MAGPKPKTETTAAYTNSPASLTSSPSSIFFQFHLKMCWRRWVLITAQGCVASNPHVIIHREKVRCQKAIDMGVRLSPYDFDWPAALKGTGPWNIGCNVELRACDGGIIQTMDSFNREIDPRSIRTPDFIDYCPCCNGEISPAKALLVCSTKSSSKIPQFMPCS